MTGTTLRYANRVMLIVAWLAALLLATQFFARWEERREHPNREPLSRQGEGFVEVQLASSRGGHYLLDGQINGQRVTLLLDTGATAVAVPQALAATLGLQPGATLSVRTANGTVQAWRTQIDRLQLGAIELRDVAALITPAMEGDQVLLGMSALKRLEFTQRDGQLLLRQTTLA